MSLKASGLAGEVRKGYRLVARLSHCTLESDTQRVDGTADEINEFWLDQGGLSLWLTIGTQRWVWRDIQIMDASKQSFAVRVNGSPDVRT